MYADALKTKLENTEAKVGVIGLGYVGLPLAFHLSLAGYSVHGIDTSVQKVEMLKSGHNYISDLEDELLFQQIRNTKLQITTDYSIIRELDVVIICVPTPLTDNMQPDLSYIEAAVKEIIQHMHPGMLIILESTTYPGTTEELIQRNLEKHGYVAGHDFFLCFSPERVDPGNRQYHTANTPKVVGGMTKTCTELGVTLYSKSISTVVSVSNPKVAEMSKLLENTFRSVNIAFMNEMAMLCEKLGINIWEAIEAARTKPFGFMPFYPGPGIGGHCIPLDPMYLSWKAKEKNFYSRFIELAQEINKSMPEHIVRKISFILNQSTKSIKSSKILLLGMAYKPDVGDMRESPSLDIYRSLVQLGAHVDYNDPFVPQFVDFQGATKHSIPIQSDRLTEYDCVVLLTKHSSYDYPLIFECSQLIMDTRNGFPSMNSSKIIRIGDSVSAGE